MNFSVPPADYIRKHRGGFIDYSPAPNQYTFTPQGTNSAAKLVFNNSSATNQNFSGVPSLTPLNTTDTLDVTFNGTVQNNQNLTIGPLVFSSAGTVNINTANGVGLNGTTSIVSITDTNLGNLTITGSNTGLTNLGTISANGPNYWSGTLTNFDASHLTGPIKAIFEANTFSQNGTLIKGSSSGSNLTYKGASFPTTTYLYAGENSLTLDATTPTDHSIYVTVNGSSVSTNIFSGLSNGGVVSIYFVGSGASTANLGSHTNSLSIFDKITGGGSLTLSNLQSGDSLTVNHTGTTVLDLGNHTALTSATSISGGGTTILKNTQKGETYSLNEANNSLDTTDVSNAKSLTFLSGVTGSSITVGALDASTVNITGGALTLSASGVVGGQTINVTGGSLTLGANESGPQITLNLSNSGSVDLGAVSGQVHQSNVTVSASTPSVIAAPNTVYNFVLDTASAVKDVIKFGYPLTNASNQHTPLTTSITFSGGTATEFSIKNGIFTFETSAGSAIKLNQTTDVALAISGLDQLGSVNAIGNMNVVGFIGGNNTYLDNLAGNPGNSDQTVCLVGVTALGIETNGNATAGYVQIS